MALVKYVSGPTNVDLSGIQRGRCIRCACLEFQRQASSDACACTHFSESHIQLVVGSTNRSSVTSSPSRSGYAPRCQLTGCNNPCAWDSAGRKYYDFCTKSHAGEAKKQKQPGIVDTIIDTVLGPAEKPKSAKSHKPKHGRNAASHPGTSRSAAYSSNANAPRNYHQPIYTSPSPPNVIYFYNKEDPYYEFTNFYPAPVTIDGRVWPTTEHYFQAMKFDHFTVSQLLSEQSPSAVASFVARFRGAATSASPLEDDVWTAVQVQVGQNPRMRDAVMRTAGHDLVFAVSENAFDALFWGDPHGNGAGRNALGKCWTRLCNILMMGEVNGGGGGGGGGNNRATNNNHNGMQGMRRTLTINEHSLAELQPIYTGAPFELEGRWATVFHFVYGRQFRGQRLSDIVAKLGSPREAFEFAREFGRYMHGEWHNGRMKERVMEAALEAKFSQHPRLRELLLATNNAALVEHTKNDAYWGDGGDGSGMNMLGRLLMAIRERLRCGGAASASGGGSSSSSYSTSTSNAGGGIGMYSSGSVVAMTTPIATTTITTPPMGIPPHSAPPLQSAPMAPFPATATATATAMSGGYPTTPTPPLPITTLATPIAPSPSPYGGSGAPVPAAVAGGGAVHAGPTHYPLPHASQTAPAYSPVYHQPAVPKQIATYGADSRTISAPGYTTGAILQPSNSGMVQASVAAAKNTSPSIQQSGYELVGRLHHTTLENAAPTAPPEERLTTPPAAYTHQPAVTVGLRTSNDALRSGNASAYIGHYGAAPMSLTDMGMYSAGGNIPSAVVANGPNTSTVPHANNINPQLQTSGSGYENMIAQQGEAERGPVSTGQ